MTTIFQKCFLCTKQIEDTELTVSAVQTESSFVFTHVLNLPNLDLDWHTFQHQVSYCSICLEKITKIRLVLEQLEELENEVLREKYEIELKLKENTLEYLGIPGQNQSSLAPVVELRDQIVTELKSRTIISMLAKIRKKRGNSDQIGCPLPPRVMKNVIIPRLSTPTTVSTPIQIPIQPTTSTNSNIEPQSPIIIVPFSEISLQNQNQNRTHGKEFEHVRLRDLLTGKTRMPHTSLVPRRRSSKELNDERTSTNWTPTPNSSVPAPAVPLRGFSQNHVDLNSRRNSQEIQRSSISNSDSLLDILTDNANIASSSSSQFYLDQRVIPIPIPHFLNPSTSLSSYNNTGMAEVNTATKNPRNVQQGQVPLFRVKPEIILPEMEVDQASEEEMSYICGICGEILHDYNLLMEHDKLHLKPTSTTTTSQIQKDRDERRLPVEAKSNFVRNSSTNARNISVIEKNSNSNPSTSNSSAFVLPSSGDCPIKCVECGNTLANAQELGEHIVRAHAHGSSRTTESTEYHTTTVRLLPLPPPKKYFECKFCPKKFSVAIHLEQHLLSHNRPLASLECRLCPNRTFKSKDHLLLHKLDHVSSGR